MGFRTAPLTLVFPPDLGSMNRGGAASLTGPALSTRESGTMKGKRCIGGGRFGIPLKTARNRANGDTSLTIGVWDVFGRLIHAVDLKVYFLMGVF